MSHNQDIAIELSLPSQLGYEKLVRQTIAWLTRRGELAAARIADLQTAVSEACINAIEHGNQALASLRLNVTLRLTPEYLEVVVRDTGVKRLLPPMAPPASIEQKLAGLAPARGMGLMLMRQLVDEVDFAAEEPEQGNYVRLRIYQGPVPGMAA